MFMYTVRVENGRHWDVDYFTFLKMKWKNTDFFLRFFGLKNGATLSFLLIEFLSLFWQVIWKWLYTLGNFSEFC
jgi:hypothetical protein